MVVLSPMKTLILTLRALSYCAHSAQELPDAGPNANKSNRGEPTAERAGANPEADFAIIPV